MSNLLDVPFERCGTGEALKCMVLCRVLLDICIGVHWDCGVCSPVCPRNSWPDFGAN